MHRPFQINQRPFSNKGLLGYLARNCHFIGNMGATSFKKVLGRKTTFLGNSNSHIVMLPNNDKFSDLLAKSDDRDNTIMKTLPHKDYFGEIAKYICTSHLDITCIIDHNHYLRAQIIFLACILVEI